jgi:hypothetical protein
VLVDKARGDFARVNLILTAIQQLSNLKYSVLAITFRHIPP